MAIIDDRTTNLNLPLPNIGNKLVDDVARLRTAFSSVDTAVALKADAETTYSKAQVDTAIAGATPSFSTLTGKPTTVAGFGITDVMTSTATQTALDLKANQATTYTKTETDTRIQAVVGAAPAALDTLVEIATQLASDESAAAALVTTVATKVDKVAGKGLSTEDFTTAEKTKLAAQVIPTTLPASDVSAWAKSATKPTYTATEVGLANVNNTTDLLKPVSTATTAAIGVETTRAMAAEALKAPVASPTFTGTVSGVTKAMVGLGSVDNTADAAKPVSTATQTALNLKVDSSTLGTMSTQSAAAVAITGGTINGITFSGGTY